MKKFQFLCAGFFIGLCIGSIATNYWLTKSYKEILLLQKSTELGDGMLSFLLHNSLVDGDIERVKKSLLENYENSKKEANSINLEKLSEENWPFTVDSWFIENLQNSIKQINDAHACNKKTQATVNEQHEDLCINRIKP